MTHAVAAPKIDPIAAPTSEVSPGPAVTSRRTALSRTVLVSACSQAQPLTASPYSGPSGLRALVGFSPNRPHADAG